MISLPTLISDFVYRFLKKKAKKENKVAPSEVSIHEFMRAQLEKGTTISNEVVELRRRLLKAIGEDEKPSENEKVEKEGTQGTTQKTDMEKLKEFLLENAGKDGSLPTVDKVTENLGLSRKQQRIAKEKLLSEGFLYKENERTYRLNEVVS